MKIDYEDSIPNQECTLCKINLNHIAQELNPIGTTVTVQNLEHLVRLNGDKCEGFKLVKGGEPVGTI